MDWYIEDFSSFESTQEESALLKMFPQSFFEIRENKVFLNTEVVNEEAVAEVNLNLAFNADENESDSSLVIKMNFGYLSGVSKEGIIDVDRIVYTLGIEGVDVPFSGHNAFGWLLLDAFIYALREGSVERLGNDNIYGDRDMLRTCIREFFGVSDRFVKSADLDPEDDMTQYYFTIKEGGKRYALVFYTYDNEYFGITLYSENWYNEIFHSGH